MAGKKKTLNNLYTEVQNLKDIHEKEINELQKVIKQQDKRIKDIERVIGNEIQKIVDIHEIEKTTNLDGVGSSRPVIRNPKKTDTKLLKCKVCDNIFTTFSDLEFHIKQKHNKYKKEECDQCGKTFVTKWRLRKHVRIHLNKFTKICQYFKTGKYCPFEELGCKFLHNVSEKFDSDYTDKEMNEKTSDSANSDDIDINSSVEETKVDGKKLPFITSTPRKIKLTCEKCADKSQCEECFVDEYIKNRKLIQEHDEMTIDV